MKITEITQYTLETKNNIDLFLNSLVEEKVSMTPQLLNELIADDNSHLFFALDDDEVCMGMLTIGIYISPLGKKAWIEDVVVGETYRGQGVGKQLMKFAIHFAMQQQVELLMLTSKSSRVTATKLYLNLGFEKKETNVYKMTF